jgi:hypothetical protein
LCAAALAVVVSDFDTVACAKAEPVNNAVETSAIAIWLIIIVLQCSLRVENGSMSYF